jgi:hypothetical protein
VNSDAPASMGTSGGATTNPVAAPVSSPVALPPGRNLP